MESWSPLLPDTVSQDQICDWGGHRLQWGSNCINRCDESVCQTAFSTSVYASVFAEASAYCREFLLVKLLRSLVCYSDSIGQSLMKENNQASP